MIFRKTKSYFFLFFLLLASSCDRAVELAKYAGNVELFGLGGEVDQRALVKNKTLPTFTERKVKLDLKSGNFSGVASNSVERDSINQFYKGVRGALLLKRELFEGKLKVIEKDAEVQATFSDYAPQLKLGTTNNYSLYKEGTNSRMSSNDYMDLYLKVDYPFLDYGRREINTQISIFQWQYQYKDLAIKVNETAFDLVKIYLEYNSLRRKKLVLEAFSENINGYVIDAQDRFLGGVSVLSEVTMTEQAKTRHNSRLASFNQIFSKAKIQYSENFPGDTGDSFDPKMLGSLSGGVFSSLGRTGFEIDQYSLEESLLAIEKNIAEYEIAQHRSEYLPRFTSSIETKAFDVDNYDGDMQVSLNLLGEFGLFDGGKSYSQIRALTNKANSVSQRQMALRKDLGTRLSSLKSEIDSAKRSVEQTKKDVIFHKAKLSEAKEMSENVAFNLSEVVSADESILDAELKLIDQEADLENLWAEVLNLHGLYPDLFTVSFDDIGR